jgi:hypothetical protein
MTPLGNCPGCGTDEPFAQVHPGQCPDVDGECPEWACVACGAAVVMGTAVMGTAVMGTAILGTAVLGTVAGVPSMGEPAGAKAPAAPVGPSVRAA